MIETFFSQNELWPEVCHVLNKLKDKNFEAVIVGGAVRDALMEKVPKDFDIATNAHPDPVKEIFKHSQFVGKSFGVIHLPFKNNQHVEIATFRKDGRYVDGRRPESVEFTSMEHDAQRRDFTINALYYDFHKKKVIDFFDGIKDLQEKKIRTVGNPEVRFQEDYLRIIRALRFSLVFNFKIEEQTLKALKDLMPQIVHLSKERVIQEFDKIFRSNPSPPFLEICLLLLNTGFLKTFWKHIPWENEVNKKFWNFHGKTQEFQWCLLFSFMVGQSSKELKNLKNTLKKSILSNQKINQVFSFFDFYKDWSSCQTRFGKRIRLLHSKNGLFYFELTKHIQENVYSQTMDSTEVLEHYLNVLKKQLPKPLIGGDDLAPFDIPPSPQMSVLLETLYDEQLEEKFSDKKLALTRLKELI